MIVFLIPLFAINIIIFVGIFILLDSKSPNPDAFSRRIGILIGYVFVTIPIILVELFILYGLSILVEKIRGKAHTYTTYISMLLVNRSRYRVSTSADEYI